MNDAFSDPGDVFPGESATSRLARACDWSTTRLGPVSAWPRSLVHYVRMALVLPSAAIVFWGEEQTQIYNDGYAMIMGPRHPRYFGATYRECWPDTYPVIYPWMRRVLDTGEIVRVEKTHITLTRYGFEEEAYFTFTFSPLRDDDGKIAGIFQPVAEVTEAVLSERRAETLRALVPRADSSDPIGDTRAALAANARDIPFFLLYLWDAGDLRLAAHSETITLAASNLGRLAEIARGVLDAHAPATIEDADRLVAQRGGPWPEPVRQARVLPLRRAAEDGRSGVVVFGFSPRLHADHRYRDFFELAAGQVSTAIATTRVLHEARQRAAALAELDRAKTAFFSNVSHELRTPLMLILGPLQDALASSSSLGADEIARAHRNALRLLKLVNALLDFSRIEAGRVRMSVEPVDLAVYTAELASVFRSAIERAGLRLVTACSPLPGLTYVDRDMWEKIVLNLVSNALKYTFEGEIRVSLRAEGGRAVLQVADTGTGIPARELPHVFERFHRVEGARGRTVEGSGIGLALVHELVKLHGGTVAVESTEGVGSTFTCAIPLGEAQLPAEPGAARQERPARGSVAAPFVAEALRWSPVEPGACLDERVIQTRGAGRRREDVRPRIVLADDNADMRDYLRRLLSPHYEVIAVGDGRAALAAVRERSTALVLTDVMMPELDGFGLLKALRDDPRTMSIPIVMLSARAGEDARVEGLRVGADDYLIKPFSARDLLARVEGTLALARARREAIRREEELRAETIGVLESIGEGFLALDEDWRLVYVNAAAERQIGRSRAELLGRSHWEVFPPTLGTAIEREFRRAARERVTVRFENYYEPWRRWFELSVYPGQGGGIVVYFRDISSRKAAEAEQQRLVERLTLLREAAVRLLDLEPPDVMLHGLFERVREHLQVDAYLGYVVDAAGDGLTLVSCAGIADEAAREVGHVAFREGIEGSVAAELRPLEIMDVQGSDDPKVARLRSLGIRAYACSPLISGERLLGTLALASRRRDSFDALDLEFMRTLCHYAAAAIERERLIARLRAEDRNKDEFLALLAHELRNPLAPLRTGLEVLRLSRGEPGVIERARAMMDRQLSHLVRLVDDLLDVSRLSRNKLTLQRKRLALAEVVASAIETAQPLIEAAGHTLAVTLPDEPVDIDGDLIRLAQVFANLLTNAAKYTPRGGTIALAGRRLGREVVVSVRDTGIGIPKESVRTIFDMFSQVDRSIERSSGGLGIGLALVKGLVEMHGGTVTAESAGVDQGSVFVVRLPVVAGAAAEPKGAGEPVSGGALRRRVLVVDDKRDAAESMAMLISLLGGEVRMAHNGIEAIEAAEAFRPQLILMDVGMPRLNGLDATRQIRERPWGANVRIIAVTGWGQEADRQQTQRAGCDGHLVKPVEVRDLEHLLASLRS